MLEYLNTAIMGGLLITGIFWVVRTIQKDRRADFNKNETGVAL
jgi:hypothetical protein